MKRRISQALAMRSTYTLCRVTQVLLRSVPNGLAPESAVVSSVTASPSFNRASRFLIMPSAVSRPMAPKKSTETTLTGRVSDRVGRIPVIIVGLLLCAAALPLIFRSESLTVFLLAAPLLGVGVGAVTPVTNALIADLASARRLGAAMGVFGTIWDIGEAAGPMIAGFLIGGLGYAMTFDVLAAVIALVSVGLMALVRDPKAAARDREAERPVK